MKEGMNRDLQGYQVYHVSHVSPSRALPGIPGMYSTKPGVSVYGDFRYVLMDYQGKIFLNIPGNNPIPTPGPFRILIRRADASPGIVQEG